MPRVSVGPLTRATGMEARVNRWTVGGVALAATIGIAATFSLQWSVAIVLVVAFAVCVALRPWLILPVLAVSFFIEQLEIGGATVGRFLAAAALLVVLAEATRGRAHLRWGPQLGWTIAYSTWALASALWSVRFDLTVHQLGSLLISLAMMIAFATILATTRDVQRVFLAVSLAALVTGAVSILSYAISGAAREEGFSGDPNFFAAYQILAIPFIIAAVAEARALWLRVLLLVTVAISIGAVFTTLSRGGILSLSILILLMLIAPARTIFRTRGQKATVTVLVGAGVILALAISFSAIAVRYTSLVTGQEAAGSGRLNEWEASVRSIEDRPVLGLGLGAFQGVSNELVKRTPGADLRDFDLRPQGTQPHTAYLGTAAELGIPGAIMFIGVLISTALALRRTAVAARRQGNATVARATNALLYSLIGFCTASIFLSSETGRPIWILVGLSLALPKLLEEERSSVPEIAPMPPAPSLRAR